MNKFGKGAGLYHVTVRATGVTAREIILVVRRGEDDDRDRGEAGIGSEPFQKVAAILAVEMQIEEDQSGKRVMVYAVFQEMERRIGVILGIEGDIEAGLDQRQAEEFAFAWAVFDQENGGMSRHQRNTSAGNVPGSKIKCSIMR